MGDESWNGSGLRAFIERYLQKKELMEGFKHSHVPSNYERDLSRKEQLRKGFEALETVLRIFPRLKDKASFTEKETFSLMEALEGYQTLAFNLY